MVDLAPTGFGIQRADFGGVSDSIYLGVSGLSTESSGPNDDRRSCDTLTYRLVPLREALGHFRAVDVRPKRGEFAIDGCRSLLLVAPLRCYRITSTEEVRDALTRTQGAIRAQRELDRNVVELRPVADGAKA